MLSRLGYGQAAGPARAGAELAGAEVYSVGARSWARRGPILEAAAATQIVLTDGSDQSGLANPAVNRGLRARSTRSLLDDFPAVY